MEGSNHHEATRLLPTLTRSPHQLKFILPKSGELRVPSAYLPRVVFLSLTSAILTLIPLYLLIITLLPTHARAHALSYTFRNPHFPPHLPRITLFHRTYRKSLYLPHLSKYTCSPSPTFSKNHAIAIFTDTQAPS